MKKLSSHRSGLLLASLLLFGSSSVSAYVFERVQDAEGNWRECDAEDAYGIIAPNLQLVMDRSRSMLEPSGVGGGPKTTNSDVTAEGSTDAGLIFIAANDPKNPTGKKALTLSNKPAIPPYIWVPSHGYNILSKLNAQTGVEEGRYAVGSNPSRTAVDLDLNAWVGSRGNGILAKVLADNTSCYDRNGNGLIDTSSGTNVLPIGTDECVAYLGIPRPTTYSGGIPVGGATIRGLAAGTDGKMWIGYSSNGGGVQSIDVATFQISPYRSGDNVPRWDRDGNGVFQPTPNATLGACNIYGMVIDRDGLLYASNTCRERLPVFDTKTNQWKANYYLGGNQGMYGITTDAYSRVWFGGWPSRSGIGVFDPSNRKVTYFPRSGQGIGVGVEPETGDVWTSLSGTNTVGKLVINQTNLASSTWTNINVGVSQWGGVGFDMDGIAWNVGNGSNHAIKINPVTNSVMATYPVGQGGHYMYSDFTGSAALAFTAPSGRWRNIYAVGVPGQVIKQVKVEATVPTDTSAGVRFRALDRNGNPISPWFPLEINGSAQFYDYTNNASSVNFPAPDYNDAPFFAEQIEIDVKLSTSVTGKRPYLHNVSFDADDSKPGILAAQEIVVGLSNAANIPGDCTTTDATKCDYLRVGLSFFDSGYQQVTVPGENTAGAITTATTMTTVDGLTSLAAVTNQIKAMPSLQDATRENYVLFVTDGKLNQKSDLLQAIDNLCQAHNRGTAPVTIYGMGLGTSSDMNVISLLGAAGGTGQCCAGTNASCGTPINVCDTAALGAYVVQTGTAPYSTAKLQNLACKGGLTSADATLFKTQLLAAAKESASKYKVAITNDPVMYNQPTYPQTGLLSDPNATKVEMNHTLWNRVELPYCEPATMSGCGLDQELILNGVNPLVAVQFKNEGWYFEDPTKRDVVRLTGKLADEVAARRVKQVTIQAACQCFKPEGSPCTVAGYEGDLLNKSRCSPGTYACNAQAFDTCVPKFRPMPEVCNGLDDDCNGFEDDLDDKRKSTKYGPGKKWSDVSNKTSAFKEELTCNFESVCVCDLQRVAELQESEKDGDKGHRGLGPSFEEELKDYLTKTFEGDQSCLCGEGLTGEDVKTINTLDAQDKGLAPAQTAPSTDPAQTAGCSSTQTSSSTPLLIFILSSLFFLPRRRKRS